MYIMMQKFRKFLNHRVSNRLVDIRTTGTPRNDNGIKIVRRSDFYFLWCSLLIKMREHRNWLTQWSSTVIAVHTYCEHVRFAGFQFFDGRRQVRR